MAQPLTVNDLRRDEDEEAVDQSPSIKGGNIRHYQREAAAGMPSQMREGQRGDERVGQPPLVKKDD